MREVGLLYLQVRPVAWHYRDDLIIIIPLSQILELLLSQLLGEAVSNHRVQDLQLNFLLGSFAEFLVGLFELALVVVDTYLC